MSNSKMTSILVKDGRLSVYNGPSCLREFGGEFVAAAIASPEKALTVNKHGLVEEWSFNPKTSGFNKVRQWGYSRDPLSIQANGDDCTVVRANGQSDMYVKGSKVRTVGSERTPSLSVSSSGSFRESSSSEGPVKTNGGEGPSGLVAGLVYKCQQAFTQPVKGPWSWICFIAGILITVLFSFILSQSPKLTFPNGYFVIAGAFLAGVGLSYVIRHLMAKILVRSWFGLPIVWLGSELIPVEETVGMTVTALGVILWLWPLWPLLIIVLTGALVFLAAFSRASVNSNKS